MKAGNLLASQGEEPLFDITDVLNSDMCIGCGGCAALANSSIAMRRGTNGMPVADLTAATPPMLEAASRVCPFSDASVNEDELAREIFPAEIEHHPVVGKYVAVHAGRLADDELLEGSSSGGLTSWMVLQLFQRGWIDGVLHVAPDESGGPKLFDYRVSGYDEFANQRRKSNYYAASLNDAVNTVRGDGRRYAVIGVPCFLKAVRSICLEDELLSNQLPYFIGLVCGHLKTDGFARSLAWQIGVQPSELADVDFRVKRRGHAANDYAFGARSVTGEWRQAPTKSLIGSNWGHGAFQPNACNYCDDIFAETADVAFGDAWLPRFQSDWKGTNVVVTRRAELDELLGAGVEAGEIVLERIDAEDAAASQGGNYRHRRIGLAVRLSDDIKAGRPVPVKRVHPNQNAASRRRRRIVRQRRRMSEKSHELFQAALNHDDLSTYVEGMTAEARLYAKIDTGGLIRRVWRKLAGTVSMRN